MLFIISQIIKILKLNDEDKIHFSLFSDVHVSPFELFVSKHFQNSYKLFRLLQIDPEVIFPQLHCSVLF